jgi:hypothetical protein
MWNKLVRYMADFSSAVLTGMDANGYPFSVRCHPKVDSVEKVLRMRLPAEGLLQPGPASLLCHSHDDKLWNLKSFLVQGVLEQEGDEWVFHPDRFIPGEGLGGQLSLIKILFQARRKTKEYLDRRNLPRPVIPWDDINAIRAEAKKEKTLETK